MVNSLRNPYEGYLVAMQFLDLTGGNFFLFSLTLLDGTLLYIVPSKSTGKNFVTNVYCFYL